MKIYTRTGDRGETGLFGGTRVMKNDPRVEAYGTIDELNAALGVARASQLPAELGEIVEKLQHELFVLGAEVACTPGKLEKLSMRLIDETNIQAMEELIDIQEEHVPPLKEFILPAGSPSGASLHLARTVARRAERRCLELEVRHEVIVYLNRLSDALFVLARRASYLSGNSETPWKAPHIKR